MKYQPLPGTDVDVSQLCFGCWGIVSDAHWGDREEDESIGAMDAAIESGVNFFDTAPMYGDGASETLLGRYLRDRGIRDKVVIASKIRPDRMKPDDVVEECEQSLHRLQTDHLDLFQTHWTDREVPLEDTWSAMIRLRDQGKVRHIGVCNMGFDDLSSVSAIERPITNQLPYNLLWRMIEAEILPLCREQQTGVLVYSPLMHGMLAGKYNTADEVPDGRARSRHFRGDRPLARHGEPGCEKQTFETIASIRRIAHECGRPMAEVSLAWLVQQPGISSVIAGARNSDQVRANVSFIEKTLADPVVIELNEATNRLTDMLGPNPDMWDGGDRSRYR